MCEWTKPNSAAGKERHRRHGEPPCQECVDARNAYRRATQPKATLTENQAHHWWKEYRIRRHDFEALLARQGGVCAICGKPFTSSRDTHVDHDHACNHPSKGRQCCSRCVRGLLCFRCNRTLVALEDKEYLKRAVAYLDRQGDRDVAEIIRQSRLW